ncbi:dihydrolipoyl dehydrogenase [Streptomyces sp. NPDC002917]|uniref:dihydrolipoyl dehydrogenase n=1 Tax=Streptomyces sp. NPDC002917 TaxID=3364671 RepID=UPI003683FDA0
MVAGEIAEPVEVLVVGGGPGGYTAAARAAELGRDVILVERGDLGGVCLNVGCIPSKVLTTAAHDLARAARFPWRGQPPRPEIDLAALQGWRKDVVDRLVSGVRATLSRVRIVTGEAFFIGPDRVSVESGEQVHHFRFDHAVIATGSAPVSVGDLRVDGGRVLDSTGALALEDVPPSLAVVGGGYVGTELGMAFARFGSRVTVVEAADSILAGFDRDVVSVVAKRAAELGIDIRTRTTATGIDDENLVIEGPNGTDRVPAHTILVAVGRRPATADLQVDRLGLTVTASGHIEVDEQGRTAVPHVFAIGDVTPGPALAHKAMAEGRTVAEVLSGLPSAFDSQVPLIAFTEPEIASVGMTVEQATEQGYEPVVGRSSFATSGRAVVLGEPEGLVKVVVDGRTDVILGVHMAGPQACDLIAEAAVLVETAARAEDLVETVHPHPSLVETVHSAAVAARRRVERAEAVR